MYINKCCDENSAITRDNITDEIFCNPVNISLTHPFLKMINNVRVLYEQSCNSTLQYVFDELLQEEMMFFENISLHVPKYELAVPLFDAQHFCFDYFDGEPGVLLCMDKSSISAQNQRAIVTYIGKFHD